MTKREDSSPARSARSGPIERLRSRLSAKPNVQLTEDHVQSVLNVRRARESIFGRQLFSDPAWDVILELHAAKLGERQMSVPELARTIGAPRSVITRWVSALVDADIVSRESGDEDAPVVLTDVGSEKLSQLVDQWGSAFLAI